MSDHNKCPSSEKEHEKCIFGLSYFHRIQPNHSTHGSDQCGYIHLLYRFICLFTAVEVELLCRLGWRSCHLSCLMLLSCLMSPHTDSPIFISATSVTCVTNTVWLLYNCLSCVICIQKAVWIGQYKLSVEAAVGDRIEFESGCRGLNEQQTNLYFSGCHCVSCQLVS